MHKWDLVSAQQCPCIYMQLYCTSSQIQVTCINLQDINNIHTGSVLCRYTNLGY